MSRRRVGAGAMEGSPYRAGDVIAGRFKVKEIVGAGPHGFVFKCQDTELDAEVALKALNPKLFAGAAPSDALQKALAQARKLSHQNLVRITGTGEDRGWTYYVTQYVEGLSLRRIIDARKLKGQGFGLAEIEPLVGQIAAGLVSAHKLGPHANLKPENVLVQPDLLKITDFGLGAGVPRAAYVQAHRERNLGGYLAPEQVNGGILDARTDVYALGVIVGEMLCGEVPVQGEVPPLLRIRPDLARPVEALYRKALSEISAARYPSPQELANELAALLQRATAGAPRQREPSPVRPSGAEPARRDIHAEPPPVPDELLPPSSRARGPGSDEASAETRPFDASLLSLRPTDETQPLDPALLAQAIAAKTAASAASAAKPGPPASPRGSRVHLSMPQPMPDPALTAARQRPAGNPVLGAESQPTQALDASSFLKLLRNARGTAVDDSPTMALPSFPPELLGPAPLFANAAPHKRSYAGVWLVILTAVGLITGTIGGYVLLQRLRRRPPEPAAVQAPAPPPPIAPGPAAAPPPAPATPPPSAPKPEDAAPSKPADEPQGAAAPAAAVKGDCPEAMKLVRAGSFRMGTAKDDPMMGFDEKTLATLELPAYCIDEYEYPNHFKVGPKVRVTWPEAKKACEAAGKRLCTEAEWEKACKGPENRRFPYGDTYDPAACNTESATGEDRLPSWSGGFDRCRSGYGALDMSGNVAEWTSSQYGRGGERTQKGGAFDKPDYAARCSARKNSNPMARAADVGFRCCADLAR